MPILLAAHTPWLERAAFLPLLLKHRICPEFYLHARHFEQISPAEVRELQTTLRDYGLFCTLHAPFSGLDPGSPDHLVQQATQRCLQQTLQLATQLRPRVVVFHSGCTGRRSGAELEEWITTSIGFWHAHLPLLLQTDTVLALENIFERQPGPLRRVIEGVRHQRLRHCFDIGHFNLLGDVSVEEWFAELGRYCVECHLHDNRGTVDEHLPLGEGSIDFTRLVRLLQRHAPAAVWTLEAHTPQRLERAYAALQPLLAAHPTGF